MVVNGVAEEVVIGLDLGTTGSKAAAFTRGGHAVAVSRRRHTTQHGVDGRSEQDPTRVVDECLETVRDVARSCLARGHTVRGLALSTAMHSLAGVDDDDRPVTGLMLWSDTRATTQAAALRSRPDSVLLQSRTGTPLLPMSPLAKLQWWAHQDPVRAATVRRWVGIKELLVHRLTGQWLVDHSIASGTGLFDCRRGAWDPLALELAEVSADVLATPVPVTHASPLSEATLGLPAGLPVVVGGADGPLANLGAGAQDGVAIVSLGTSAAIRVTTGVAPPVTGRLFCYAAEPGRYAVGGALTNCGQLLEWLGGLLAIPADDLPRHLDATADVPAGAEGLLVLPFLLADRVAPEVGGGAGALVGLGLQHGPLHVLRAALEAVVQHLALLLEDLLASGCRVEALRATGGLANSDAVCQALADATGLPVTRPDEVEGAALGAALVGWQALDRTDAPRTVCGAPKAASFEPQAGAHQTLVRNRTAYGTLAAALGPTLGGLAERERQR